MSGLWPLRAAIFVSFIVEACLGYCGSEECNLYDCCAGYQNYGYGPLVRCQDVDESGSIFDVVVNEIEPRIALPLLFRPNNGSNQVPADLSASQGITVRIYHPDNHCFDGRLPACTEMPVIEFGTKSCKVQATIGCGNHSEDDPILCDPDRDDSDVDHRIIESVFQVKGLEFLSDGLGVNASTGLLLPNCNTEIKPGCDEPIACDFDPDNDGYALDFYVELKNKPGCVSRLQFFGWPGILPLKVNATGAQ